MKCLKLVAKCVSNLDNKEASTNSHILKRRLGMSAVELLMVIGVSSVIMAGAGAVLVFVADSFIKIVDKDEAETSLTRAAYALRLVATQAVNLKLKDQIAPGEGIGEAGESGFGATTGLLNGQILTGVDTLVTSFQDIATNAASRSRIVELAAFYREASFVGDSQFWPTGIFFKTPWHACPPDAAANVDMDGDGVIDNTRSACSGQLIIVTNNTGGDSPGTIAQPIFRNSGTQLYSYTGNGLNAEVFDRLTSIVLTSTGTGGGGAGTYARDARFRLTARYFLSGKPENFNYNPVIINDPADPKAFLLKEVSMEVYVGFRNNYLGKSMLVSGEPERLHGSLYYFPFASPLIQF